MTLRCWTYLAGAIPLGYFRAVCDWLAERLDTPISLHACADTSGPAPEEVDPFSAGEADLGFVCAGAYLWLRDRDPSPVRRLPVGEVPVGETVPVYSADVVVRAGDDAACLADLRGRRLALNDMCSLSGWLALRARLHAQGETGWPGPTLHTGAHAQSLRAVQERRADVASIDSRVLRHLAPSGLRVLTRLGPYPTPPLLVRAGLSADLGERMTRALLAAQDDPDLRGLLHGYGVSGFVRQDEAAFDDLAAVLSLAGG